MPVYLGKGQTVQAGERKQTDRWTDRRYQMHYLPALLRLSGRLKLCILIDRLALAKQGDNTFGMSRSVS